MRGFGARSLSLAAMLVALLWPASVVAQRGQDAVSWAPFATRRGRSYQAGA
jgi:hypothetical protein